MPALRRFFIDHRLALLALAGTWGLYFIVIFARMIFFDAKGLWVGHPSVWSDWALHIGMVNIFATKPPELWFDYHPIYAGGQFTYTFLTNLISGLLMRAGLSLPLAFILPSIVYSLTLLLGLYVLAYTVLKSQKGALLAISFFLLASGPSFLHFFTPEARINWPAHAITALPQYDWYTGNFIDGMLVPQRSFLLGLVFGVWALSGLLTYFGRQDRLSRWVLFLSGLLAGLLPITHMHSYIVVGIIALFLALSQPKAWRSWSLFALPALGLGMTLYWFFVRGGIENQSFIHWQPFWTAQNFWDWIKQWWLQWGLMIPLAVWGLLIAWRQSTTTIKAFYVSFFAIWLLACFVLFQPVRWDNTKLFLWSYWGFSLLAVVALHWLWRRTVWLKGMSLLLAIGLTASGVIEAARVQASPAHPYLLSSQDDISLGQFAKTTTDPKARFLTAPQHNEAIMMWGARPILMGYPAWVWNFGFDYSQRERDIATMYQGGPAALSLLTQYRVSYVVIGSSELRDLAANEDFFAERFPLIYNNPTYRVYDVQELLR